MTVTEIFIRQATRSFLDLVFPLQCTCPAILSEKKISTKGRDYMSWPEIREINGNGLKFGSHSKTHGLLKFMNERKLKNEIIHSKQAIQERLGEEVDTFSYPYAFPETDKQFKRLYKEILIESGFRNAVTTIIGTVTSDDYKFFYKRLPANVCDDTRLFQAKLNGAYNWMHVPQYASKVLKNLKLKWIRPANG